MTKTCDRWTSLFWLVLSIYVCVKSIHMGVGTLRNPDLGFITFGTSILLGILAVCLFLRTLVGKKESKPGTFLAGTLWKRVLGVFIALLIYARWMSWGGYLISTFLLMGFLFWIVKGHKWRWVFISAVVTTLLTYYVFSVLLKGQFPAGPFGF